MSTYLTPLIQRTAMQAPAPAPQQQPAGSYLSQLSPEVLKQLSTDPNAKWTDPASGWVYYGNWSAPTAGNDENPALPAQFLNNLIGIPGLSAPDGSPMALYGANGAFSGQGRTGVQYDFMDRVAPALAIGILTAGAMAGFEGLGATAGEGAADSALTVQGNSINALDGATGVGYGSEGSLLTGSTDVGANYSLIDGTTIKSGVAIDNNAGQGLLIGSPSGTGLTMPTAPNLEAMGGAQGLTATGAQGVGNASSFINNPAYQLPGAGSQTVSAAGTFNPYVPSLGDPASFINGGAQAAGSSLSLAPGDVLKGIQLGGQLAGLLGGSGSLGGGDQASYAGGGVGGTADSSNAGMAPSLGAQGGAAGSIEGVANTLLTAKDTFGYGKSMLG